MPAAPSDDTPEDRPGESHRDGLFIRLYFGDGRFLGPGKIELLETIRDEHSILSAARKLGMSYRRAWLLVDELDRMFAARVVATHPGRRGRGTELTPFGETLIATYRAIEQKSAVASKQAVADLRAALADDWPRQAAAPPQPPAVRPAPAGRRKAR